MRIRKRSRFKIYHIFFILAILSSCLAFFHNATGNIFEQGITEQNTIDRKILFRHVLARYSDIYGFLSIILVFNGTLYQSIDLLEWKLYKKALKFKVFSVTLLFIVVTFFILLTKYDANGFLTRPFFKNEKALINLISAVDIPLAFLVATLIITPAFSIITVLIHKPKLFN
ncbi:hypothetical protein [Tenacibaculum agarivorans]|uniref:hypothetical protein n=1 Tax=Tenacibaculum agarivorans TaxID=1908389 RepID=UPI00094B90A2|nr:hypothetical protein [Tenacibaculum agarivorans]